jgi:hypothetical protein
VKKIRGEGTGKEFRERLGRRETGENGRKTKKRKTEKRKAEKRETENGR